MRNYFNYFTMLFMATALCVVFTACSKEDDEYSGGNSSSGSSSSKLSYPELKSNLTTTTKDDLTFRVRFSNGDDKSDNMRCVVHWGKFSSKPSATPKASSLSKSETMRQYSSTKTSTTFDKAHTRLSGGTYIYYYFECSNSRYTTKSNVTYTIIKR